MEKTFEEKFGLKTEEMEKILGGAPLQIMLSTNDVAGGNCSFCSTCVYCSTCVGCTGECIACRSNFADVVPLE